MNKDKVNIHLVNPAANCIQFVLKGNSVGIRAAQDPTEVLILGLSVILMGTLGSSC